MYSGWDAKSKSITDALNRLSLAARDCVFVDDNPHECAEVLSVHKDIQLIDFRGDLTALIRNLNIRLNSGTQITVEDRNRAGMYAARLSREAELTNAQDKVSWLQSLNTKVEISSQSAYNLDPRVVQLFQRSNQFNQNGRKIDEHYIVDLLADDYECFISSLEDRHGSEGTIFSCIYKRNSYSIVIEDLCMSCRVLGRSVELVTLLALMQEAKACALYVNYRDTQRNGRFKDFVKTYMVIDHDKSIHHEYQYQLIELDRQKMLDSITTLPTIVFCGNVITLEGS